MSFNVIIFVCHLILKLLNDSMSNIFEEIKMHKLLNIKLYSKIISYYSMITFYQILMIAVVDHLQLVLKPLL